MNIVIGVLDRLFIVYLIENKCKPSKVLINRILH